MATDIVPSLFGLTPEMYQQNQHEKKQYNFCVKLAKFKELSHGSV